MSKKVFIISPVLASVITGGLSWFLGGAIPGTISLYTASTVGGALIGILVALGPLRSVSKELNSLREKAARVERIERIEGKERVQSTPIIQDVRELREFVTGLTKVLKTAEEVEAMRSAELEKAVREVASDLAEVERLMDAARQKVSEAGKILAEVEAGGGDTVDSAAGGWNRH